jgi:hypothetical protein
LDLNTEKPAKEDVGRHIFKNPSFEMRRKFFKNKLILNLWTQFRDKTVKLDKKKYSYKLEILEACQ